MDETPNIAVPSIVSQLSTKDGFEYTYAKDAKGEFTASKFVEVSNKVTYTI